MPAKSSARVWSNVHFRSNAQGSLRAIGKLCGYTEMFQLEVARARSLQHRRDAHARAKHTPHKGLHNCKSPTCTLCQNGYSEACVQLASCEAYDLRAYVCRLFLKSCERGAKGAGRESTLGRQESTILAQMQIDPEVLKS